ncbi:MAG: S9 family peptidase [bacterium]|nr:S9 family peptidase [bacterium]
MLPRVLLCLLLLVALPALAEDTPEPIAPDRVLFAGPVPVALPAFHDAATAGVELKDLLGEQTIMPGRDRPAAGDLWQAVVPGALEAPGGAAMGWTAFYVTSDRYQKAKLTVVTSQEIKGALNGAGLSLAKAEGDTLTADLELEMGTHLVVLRTLFAGEEDETWSVDMAVSPAAEAGDLSLRLGIAPTLRTDIRLVLNSPRMGSMALSPDGSFTAISLSEYRDGENRESWLEIRGTDGGQLVAYWRGGGVPTGLHWLHTGNRVTWATETDGKTTVWLHDLANQTVQPVLEGVADIGRWSWSPEGDFLVYAVNVEAEDDDRRVKRVKHPADRQPWDRNRSYLMQAFPADGTQRRLTAGTTSPGSWRISPDGGSVLFFVGEPDITNRPFFTSELWLLDLADLSVEKLLDDPWIGGAEFSPTGDVLVLQGSPSAFDGLGRDLPENVTPNDYGGQLFLWSLADREPVAITREFTPAVAWIEWASADDRIYARCTDTQYSNIYRYDTGDDEWEQVDTGFGFTDEIELPLDGRRAVARGTSGTTPNRLHAVDLKKNRWELIHDPGAEQWRDVEFGVMTPWQAPLPNGELLDGRIYFPPGFDAAKKYPVIVYYYGGTSPVTVDFGGRYPKNVWAGQDYIIYVPQPSGATGYGQEMAARHVNDWGRITAMEVIEGTRAFLAAHPYADPEAVGCIGASYGGFLTEYVVTQTDLFAAAVSHAGISSISSYWGEGLWGYAYGARALADAYPWSDKELYVEQSALFHADKITTPLLMVHGDSDTNVPVGESDQLFTALKILGREVEYVQIQGQNHWVLDHGQRVVWNDTILAFFAKYLKGRDGWWEGLYPSDD